MTFYEILLSLKVSNIESLMDLSAFSFSACVHCLSELLMDVAIILNLSNLRSYHSELVSPD